MRVLVIDQNGCGGCGVNISVLMLNDGHQVRTFIGGGEKSKYVGNGILNKIKDWRDHLGWCDFVFITENNKYLKELDAFRANGGLVFGPTLESAGWEIDRSVGQKIFDDHEISTIPFKMFTDYDEAIRYVKKEDRRFVSKPAGDADDKALSYVSKSPADMVYMLERWKKLDKIKSPFMLQEFVKGIEFAVSGWIGPEGFAEGWFENFEHKKLMDGEKGPNTGEMGTVIRGVKRSKIAEKVLKPLEEAIIKSGHTGDIDVNCIVDEKGNAWPLEFTNRCGWPSTNIAQALLKDGEDHAQWMYDLLLGYDTKPWKMNEVTIGVLLAIPDFPYSHATRKEVIGMPLYGLTEKNLPHIHPCEMMLGRAPHNTAQGVKDMDCLVTAGDYVMVVTGNGDTVTAARKEVYGIIDKIEMPGDVMYRLDIGSRLKKQLPELQENGYAADMEF